MSEENELASWIAHAEDDYGSAKSLLRRKKPFVYSACFHAQQCTEKYLKALLVFKEQYFPKTHDLRTLNELCEKTGIFTGINPDTLDLLTAFSVIIRYPGDDPTLEEAREAIQIAKAVRRFARKFRLFGMFRDAPPYLATRRKAELIPPYIWRIATPIPNEPKFLGLNK